MSQSQRPSARPARAQLSIVEHALSPLDSRRSLVKGMTFETSFHFTDQNRNRKDSHATVVAVHGLSSADDLYLWGLLGLALSQPDASPDFYATPYWCLKQLGIIDDKKKGSEEFRLFRNALRRLAGVRYACDAFFDPVRREHREVAFGFLSYSLPLTDGKSRTWRFAWDPIFWELCSTNAGALRFDLPIYRDLSPASRRLYLLLKKLFWRSDETSELEIRDLAVHALGFSDALPTKILKVKLASCVRELLDRGLVQLGLGQGSVAECFTKKQKGLFTLKMHCGPTFHQVTEPNHDAAEDSPLFEPLAAIGFDAASIARIIKRYPTRLIQLWSDITLAAVEQRRIEQSPQAFFHYYIKRAAADQSTPPDWWRDVERKRRRQEEEQRRERQGTHHHDSSVEGFQHYLENDGREAFNRVMLTLKGNLQAAGRSEREAAAFAKEQALIHFENKFRADQKRGVGAMKTHSEKTRS